MIGVKDEQALSRRRGDAELDRRRRNGRSKRSSGRAAQPRMREASPPIYDGRQDSVDGADAAVPGDDSRAGGGEHGEEAGRVAGLMAELSGRGSSISASSCPTCTASRAPRPCRSTRSRTMPAHGLNFYGGVIGLDTSSNVVPASGLHTQQNYADQLLFPDPELVPRHPLAARRRQASSASATGMTASRSARRRAWSSPSWSSAANELGYDVVIGHEYEYYLLDAATKKRLYEGIHIFHTVRNHYVPFLDTLVPTLRAYGIDIITHNCEYAGSQYETNYGPGKNIAGRRQGLRLQERHEGARPPQRPDRELHGQALRRPLGQRLPSPHQPRRPQDRQERLPRRQGRERPFGASAPPSSKASSRTRRR